MEINSYAKTLMRREEKYIEPMFIYSYSIFESTITEILRYYLIAFPEKINKNIMHSTAAGVAGQDSQDHLRRGSLSPTQL